METNGQPAAATLTASRFLNDLHENVESLYWAVEEIFHAWAKDTSGEWEAGALVRLDPQEALILRLSGFLGEGSDAANSLRIRQEVGRVRNELEFRQRYGGAQALADAQRVAEEAAERDRIEGAQLRATIAEAQAKLDAIGAEAAEAQRDVASRLDAKEKLAGFLPPFIQQRVDAARGRAKRTKERARVNELEGVQHAIREVERRIREWEAVEDFNKKNPDRQTMLPDKPALTHEQMQQKCTLAEDLQRARRAYEVQLGDMKRLISDFLEHGYRGPDPA